MRRFLSSERTTLRSGVVAVIAATLHGAPAYAESGNDWFAGAHAGWTYIAGPLAPMASAGGTARAEFGHALGPVDVGGMLSATYVNSATYQDQAEIFGCFQVATCIPGDFSVTRFGPIAKWKIPIGPVAITAQGSVGLAMWSSPMDDKYYEEEVVKNYWGGSESRLGTKSTLFFVGGGATLAQDVADGPAAQLSVLGAYISGVGPVADVLFGVGASF